MKGSGLEKGIYASVLNGLIFGRIDHPQDSTQLSNVSKS